MPEISAKTTWNPPPVHRIVAIILSRWKGIAIGAALGLIVALVALAMATPRYSISASIMLQMGREMTAPVTLNGSIAMPAEKRPEDIATAVEMMSGQDLIEQVVDSFGEDYFYGRPAPAGTLQKIKRSLSDALQSTMEGASSAFSVITGKRPLTRMQKVIVATQKDLTIEPARRSDVVNLTLVSTDPDKGKQLLDRFIDMYRQKHLEGYQTPQAREFFEKEHDRIGRELTEAENAIVKYKAQHQVYSGDDQRKLLLEQQQGMQVSYDQLQVDEARVTAEIADLQKSIDALPADVSLQSVKQRNPLLDTLRGKLADAEGNLAKVKSRYTDDSRPVQDAAAEVQNLRDQLGAEDRDPFVTYSETQGANDVRKALQADLLKEKSVLDGLHSQVDLKQSQLARVAGRLVEVDAADTENVRRTREVQLLEQSYKLYSKNLEDARISEAMDTARISNIAVTEPPTASLVPTYPPTTLWLAAGVVLGAAIPLAVGFAGDALRPVVRGRSELQSILGVPTLAVVPELREIRKAAISDEFVQLCVEIKTAHPSARTILVTAADAGAGASTVASALASSLVNDHRCRVLVVDAHHGHAAPQTQVAGLSRSAVDGRGADAIAKLRSVLGITDVDVILIDAGPITESPLVRAIVGGMDCTLLVAAADETPVDKLDLAKEQLSRGNAKLIGGVLNRNGRYLPRALQFSAAE